MSPEFEAMLTPAPETEEEKEFREWLRNNLKVLEKHNIAEMALAAGFKKEVVYRILSHFQEELNGIPIELKMVFNLIEKIGYTESTPAEKKARDDVWANEVKRRLYLKPVWHDVIEYQTGEPPKEKAA